MRWCYDVIVFTTLISIVDPSIISVIDALAVVRNNSERMRLLIYVPVSRGRPLYELLALARCSFDADPTDSPFLAVKLLHRDLVIHLLVVEGGPQLITTARKQRMAQVVDMVVQKSDWITRGFFQQRVSGADQPLDGDPIGLRLSDDFSKSYTFIQRLDVKTCPLQRGWLERWIRPLAGGAVVVSPAQVVSSTRPECEGAIHINAMFKTGQQLTRILLHAQRLNVTRTDDFAVCIAASQLYGDNTWLASPLL